MSDNNDNKSSKQLLLKILKDFRAEHRLLDIEISALYDTGATDIVNIARMKKMKLRLKDKIAAIEDEITPDIIA